VLEGAVNRWQAAAHAGALPRRRMADRQWAWLEGAAPEGAAGGENQRRRLRPRKTTDDGWSRQTAEPVRDTWRPTELIVLTPARDRWRPVLDGVVASNSQN
jgi:hypothetical protein